MINNSEKKINHDLINKIADYIANSDKPVLSVEEIQDIVVKKLMASSEKDIAMSYQSYRVLKNDMRNKEKKIYRKISELVDTANDDILNENANKDGKTFQFKEIF